MSKTSFFSNSFFFSLSTPTSHPITFHRNQCRLPQTSFSASTLPSPHCIHAPKPLPGALPL